MGELPSVFNKENSEVIVYNPGQDLNEENNFWYVEKNKIIVDSISLLDMLHQSGFRKYLVEQDYFFVFVNNRIVQEVNINAIKKYVKKYILDPAQEYQEGVSGVNIYRSLNRMSPALFNRGNLEFMEDIEDDFKYDTRTESFIYFNNCYVEVTADEYKVHDYRDLDKYIWRAQQINRNFQNEEKESDFKTFILQICRFDENRYNALRSAIGYLLHTYKDPSNAKAIIFMDEKIDDGSNGGSGKSLLGTAISKVRKSLRIGGKNFRFDRFTFQSYDPGTNIIEFNDVQKNFQFEMLFTSITDSITIEKKNRDEIIIPFEFSPKILLSTNFTIKGFDDSSLRRQFVIEFSDYYNKSYTPREEFGKRFFDDWTDSEWNSFYVFMIGCLQYFLKNGLVEYERVNLEVKKLVESTSYEFVEFIEDVELNKWYNKKEMFNKFVESYPEFNNNKFYQRTFTLWLMHFAKIKNYKLEEKKNNAERLFRLRTPDFVEPENTDVNSFDEGYLF